MCNHIASCLSDVIVLLLLVYNTLKFTFCSAHTHKAQTIQTLALVFSTEDASTSLFPKRERGVEEQKSAVNLEPTLEGFPLLRRLTLNLAYNYSKRNPEVFFLEALLG